MAAVLGSNESKPSAWSATNMRPSLWNFSPLGSPSHSAKVLHSPAGVIFRIRPYGMSTQKRLP